MIRDNQYFPEKIDQIIVIQFLRIYQEVAGIKLFAGKSQVDRIDDPAHVWLQNKRLRIWKAVERNVFTII